MFKERDIRGEKNNGKPSTMNEHQSIMFIRIGAAMEEEPERESVECENASK